MSKETRTRILRIVSLVAVLGITVFLFINRERVKELEAFGYPGIFLFSMAANATLILPMPGVLVTSAMGAVFNPFWVAIAAGSGAALGEISGYMAGFSGQGVIERREWHDRVIGWMRKYGDVVIFLLALIPNPLFDIAGLTAGMLKLPLYRFLFWSWLGKVLKMMAFAYGGSTVLGWFD